MAAGRKDGRGHRAESPEPAGRVRVGPARSSWRPDRGERALRRGPGSGQEPALLRHHGRVGREQRHQSVDHRAGVGDRRHAPDRPGVHRWLHRAGPTSHAFPRDARVDGSDRPQCPARAGVQRGHRRRRGCRAGLRSRPGALVGLPPAQRTERAPRHRQVRAALERDPAGHGAGRDRDVLRRRLPGPRHHPHAGGRARSPDALRHRARSTARWCPGWSPW